VTERASATRETNFRAAFEYSAGQLKNRPFHGSTASAAANKRRKTRRYASECRQVMTRSLSIHHKSGATKSVLKDLAFSKNISATTMSPNPHLLIGTPASSKASVPAQTVAIDEEPLLSVIVLSSLHTKGKSSSDGRMGMSARSAKFP
jgi:hypothetical protein